MAGNIAAYDPLTGHWVGLGYLGAFAYALTALPNGDLVVGGAFSFVGGVGARYIARWNGTSWSALGTGMNGIVRALTTLPSGDLIAGGEFSTAGGVAANYIARWDGTTWSPLGSGMKRTNLARAYEQLCSAKPPMPALAAHLRETIRASGSAYAYRPPAVTPGWVLD